MSAAPSLRCQPAIVHQIGATPLQPHCHLRGEGGARIILAKRREEFFQPRMIPLDRKFFVAARRQTAAFIRKTKAALCREAATPKKLPRAIYQRRRRGIFVETKIKIFSAPSGAAYSAMIIFRCRSYGALFLTTTILQICRAYGADSARQKNFKTQNLFNENLVGNKDFIQRK